MGKRWSKPKEEEYEGMNPVQYANHKHGPEMCKGMEEVFRQAGMHSTGTFKTEWWEDLVRTHKKRLQKEGILGNCIKWREMCKNKDVEEACKGDKGWVEFMDEGYPDPPPPPPPPVVPVAAAYPNLPPTPPPLPENPTAPQARDDDYFSPARRSSQRRWYDLRDRGDLRPPSKYNVFTVKKEQAPPPYVKSNPGDPGTTCRKCGFCVPYDLPECPRCGRVPEDDDPLCSVGTCKSSEGIFPVTIQVSDREEQNPQNPAQIIMRRTTSTQYHPWKNSEIREMQKDCPDPNKQPQQCADYMRRMQDIYKATWVDMTQLGRVILGANAEREVEAQTAQNGAAIVVPADAEQRTEASGQVYVQKVLAWATVKAANLPAIQMGRQSSSQTVKQSYDKCLEAHEAGGYNPEEVKDRLIIKQAFLGGLQPALRKRFYEVRPEADRMTVENSLDVLSALEEQEERKKKQAPVYVVMAGEQGESKNTGKPPMGPCFFCKKPGHIKKDCRKYKSWLQKNGKSQEPVA